MTLEWFFATIPILLQSCRKNFISIFPYLVAGVFIGELLKFTSWTKLIYKWVSKSPFISVISASVIGILSPLCTYGTIPAVIELYKSGIHIAPLVTFLSASSLMNPQLFIMTLGGVGIEMAIARLTAVFIFSVALGMLSYLIPIKYIIKKDIALYDDGGTKRSLRKKKIFIIRQYIINCIKNLKNVGFYLLIGILLGSIIEVYIPSNWIFNTFQAGRVTSILFAALLGFHDDLLLTLAWLSPIADIHSGILLRSFWPFLLSALPPAPLPVYDFAFFQYSYQPFFSSVCVFLTFLMRTFFSFWFLTQY